MEKSRREKKVWTEAAERFDLPSDLVAGLPHVEITGNRQFYMERHRGILSYSDKEIAINGENIIIKVGGEKLELQSMTGDALRIAGEIRQVEWIE